jgi:hypothetical protein
VHQFSRQVLELLAAMPAEQTQATNMVTEFVVAEEDWFEAAESKLLDDVPAVDTSFLFTPGDAMNARQTKEQCRKALAQTGYRECGWPALALFDHMLQTFTTGRDWVQANGWSNVPPETGYGLVPSLMVTNASLWAVQWLNAAKAGDVEYGARAACKLAYLMTVIFMGCPHPRLREEDQPPAEALT